MRVIIKAPRKSVQSTGTRWLMQLAASDSDLNYYLPDNAHINKTFCYGYLYTLVYNLKPSVLQIVDQEFKRKNAETDLY